MVHHAAHAAGQTQGRTHLNHPTQAEIAAAFAADAAALQAAAIEAGRLLFAAECRFFYASQRIDQLPPTGLPELAFAGRSNVGKSSLINALTGHNALARASNQPGRTKQLNISAAGSCWWICRATATPRRRRR